MLDQKKALQLFEYNPGTGILTRLTSRGGMKVGAVAGTVGTFFGGKKYVHVGVDGKKYLAHRLIWLITTGEWPAVEIDHINGCGTDNRLGNLREASAIENKRNKSRHKNNTSGIMGVSWYKAGKKWHAHIRAEGRRVHLGYFENINDAIAARQTSEINFGFHENHGSTRPL